MLVSSSRHPLMNCLLMGRCSLIHGMLVSGRCCPLMDGLLMCHCSLLHRMLVSGNCRPLMNDLLMGRCSLVQSMLVGGSCRTLMNCLLMGHCSLLHSMLVSGNCRTLMNGLLMSHCSLLHRMLLHGCSLIRSPLTCDGRRMRRRRSMNWRRCGPPHRLRMWPLLLRRRRPSHRLGLRPLLAWLRLGSLLSRLPLGHRLALARWRSLSPRRWRVGMLLLVILRRCADCESKYGDERQG